MTFDPYHKWLGIPPDEQPASHYRLLSVPQFESDTDVMETAAERQTLLLRTFQTGPDAELAERLLNEVAAARVCLLRPESKAQYDSSLRDAVAKTTPPPAVFPVDHQQAQGGLSETTKEPPAPNLDSINVDSILEEEYGLQPLESPRPFASSGKQPRKEFRLDSYLVPVIVVGLLLIPVVIFLWWFNNGRAEEVTKRKTRPTQRAPDARRNGNSATRTAAERLAARRAAKIASQNDAKARKTKTKSMTPSDKSTKQVVPQDDQKTRQKTEDRKNGTATRVPKSTGRMSKTGNRFSLSGSDGKHRIEAQGEDLSISGYRHEVTLTGKCGRVLISGHDHRIYVEEVAKVSMSGRNNIVYYVRGANGRPPEVGNLSQDQVKKISALPDSQ